MATQKEKSEIAKLQTDVAVIKNDMSYVKKNLDSLSNTVSKLAFAPASLEDRVDRLETEVMNEIKELKQYNFDNRLDTVFAGLLSNRAMTYIIGIIIAAAIYYVVKTGGQP